MSEAAPTGVGDDEARLYWCDGCGHKHGGAKYGPDTCLGCEPAGVGDGLLTESGLLLEPNQRRHQPMFESGTPFGRGDTHRPTRSTPSLLVSAERRAELRRAAQTFLSAGANYSTVPGVEYLAATTPATVLALLDMLDHTEADR